MKPCPFCGHNVTSVGSDPITTDHYWIWCCNCGARGPRVNSAWLATKTWDQRHVPVAERDLDAEMKRLLSVIPESCVGQQWEIRLNGRHRCYCATQEAVLATLSKLVPPEPTPKDNSRIVAQWVLDMAFCPPEVKAAAKALLERGEKTT